MVYRITFLFLSFFTSSTLYAQDQVTLDSLRSAFMKMDQRIETVELNLAHSKRKFQTGILVSTIGYTTVITGGLMLGRDNDSAGQALLVVGGITGVVGTYLMVNAFNHLTGKKKRRNHAVDTPSDPR